MNSFLFELIFKSLFAVCDQVGDLVSTTDVRLTREEKAVFRKMYKHLLAAQNELRTLLPR